jgi:hypothetical protein
VWANRIVCRFVANRGAGDGRARLALLRQAPVDGAALNPARVVFPVLKQVSSAVTVFSAVQRLGPATHKRSTWTPWLGCCEAGPQDLIKRN